MPALLKGCDMPKRDDPINIDDLPSLQANEAEPESVAGMTGENEAGQTSLAGESQNLENNTPEANFKKTQATSPRISKLAVLALLLAAISMAAAGYLFKLLQQQQADFKAANSRLALLEKQLSSTDESISQSSVAMQVKLNDVKERTDELWTQMDKLWASAWRRNQTEITAHQTQLEAHKKQLATLNKQLASVEKNQKDQQSQTKKLQTQLSKASADVKKLNDLKQKLLAQQKLVSRAQQQVADVTAKQKSLEALANENAQWIQSINIFRKQTNQTLSRLQSQAASSSTP